ncbi:hypothetical protein ACTD5D_30905 [Nocardia takedensis]|uniref:hypothetical protein n=1 Tax=Nocardia takedensis TaxID=259390 RepID=UPI003F76832D
MRTNMYPAACAECGRRTTPNQGFLFGNSNTVVCMSCVYADYAQRHGYWAPRPATATD